MLENKRVLVSQDYESVSFQVNNQSGGKGGGEGGGEGGGGEGDGGLGGEVQVS